MGGTVNESAAIGVGMISRAGVGLAIVSVALTGGFISRRLFSAFAMLVLVSVLVTPSLLQAILRLTNGSD